jgi:hypothetical protein
LPTFGWPPGRPGCLRSAASLTRRREHGDDLRLGLGQPSPRAGTLEELDLFLRKIERRFDQEAQLDDLLGEQPDLARERAIQRAGRRARRGSVLASMSRPPPRPGQVELVVEKARSVNSPGRARRRRGSRGLAESPPSAAASAAASRQRASSSCITMGPPCACSSSTSSPV